jgi:hypothetical protein
MEIMAELVDVVVYGLNTGQLIKMKWSEIKIYINGALSTTLSSSSLDQNSTGSGPNYVPVIAIGVSCSGGVTAGRINVPTFVYDPCSPSSTAAIEYETTVTGSCGAGFRFKDATGAWQALPIHIVKREPPAGSGCPYGLTLPAVTATDCWSATIPSKMSLYYKHEYVGRQSPIREYAEITCTSLDPGVPPSVTQVDCHVFGLSRCDGSQIRAQRDVYKTTTRSESKGGEILSVYPDLERDIVRIGEYASSMVRVPFPQVVATSGRSCVDGATTSTSTSSPTIYPELSVFAGTLQNDDHALLEPLGYRFEAPISIGSSKSESETFQFEPVNGPGYLDPDCDFTGICAGESTIKPVVVYEQPVGVNKAETVSYSTLGSVGAGGGPQSHAVPFVRYIGSWGNPLWLYGHFTDNWELNGSPVNYADYWEVIRERYQYNPLFDDSDNLMTRNSDVSDTGNEGAHRPWWNTFMGGTSMVGISLFDVEEVALPVSVTIDSRTSSLWDSPDTSPPTITLTSKITITAP